MTADQARIKLTDHLREEGWMAQVGITEAGDRPALLVTVNVVPVEQTFTSPEFEGFPVLFRKMGRTT